MSPAIDSSGSLSSKYASKSNDLYLLCETIHGQFLSELKGNHLKTVDQKYTQKTDDQVFQYNHHEDFVKNALKEGFPDLTDRFILKVFKHFRY